MGSRIAVIAEADDDASSVEIPPEDTDMSASSKTPPQELSKSSDSKSETPKNPKDGASAPTEQKKAAVEKIPGKAQKQSYPLYPSVSQLFHEHGLDKSEADKIPATGPGGRLLKGDVLAYIGSIKASYPLEQSKRLSGLAHLDLSSIKLAPKQSPTPSKEKKKEAPELEQDTEIAVSISFKAVQEVQQRVQKVLGIDISLDTFISRAVDLSNADLPRPANASLNADELFGEVLGLNKVDTSVSNGVYLPQITALPSTMRIPRWTTPKQPDIIDILTEKPTPMRSLSQPKVKSSDLGGATTIFSVNVAKGEEKRARVFLERVKTILQVDPGSLVL